MVDKARVTLGGVTLAGNSAISWKLQVGTQPYRTVMQVHVDDWPLLKSKMGTPLVLKLQAQNKTVNIREVYVLHTVASDSPHRVSFVVADRRWKFAYVFVARDYNITRRSGEKIAPKSGVKVPVENLISIDEYTFKRYSLKAGRKWTAEEALTDVLTQITSDGGSRWFVESFPLNREFTLQNVVLRDQGDVALSRLLGFIPGADVYVDIDGIMRVIDTSDIGATEKHLATLKDATWEGEVVETIDRSAIRPASVKVYFPREIEAMFQFTDDWSKDAAGNRPDKLEPFLQNVMPTVDPITRGIKRYHPDTGEVGTGPVPAGVWVPVDELLEAWNSEDGERPDGSLPWTFETIKRHWLHGDLEGVLGGGGSRGIPDLDINANIMLRVQSIRQHFRQTFRINPRYMDRFRSVEAIRVGPVDPISGVRSYAGVWGQVCFGPTLKGQRMMRRKSEEKTAVYRNIDFMPDEGIDTTAKVAGPARVSFLDRDQGIFRVQYMGDPYGKRDVVVPCLLVDKEGNPAVPSRNLKDQHKKNVATGARMNGGTNGIFLKDTLEMNVILTVIPGAPNNKNQFHTQEVEASDIAEQFQSSLRIEDGDGPVLEIFVQPGESMARYQWEDDADALFTLKQLMGIEFDDPTDTGLVGISGDLRGYTWTNEGNEVKPHALAVAAEALASFADMPQGRRSTPLVDAPVLRGGMSAATIQIGAAPSARVSMSHEFPGMQKAISRFALDNEVARHMVLGIVPLREADK